MVMKQCVQLFAPSGYMTTNKHHGQEAQGHCYEEEKDL
jgi:hypothetical protein